VKEFLDLSDADMQIHRNQMSLPTMRELRQRRHLTQMKAAALSDQPKPMARMEAGDPVTVSLESAGAGLICLGQPAKNWPRPVLMAGRPDEIDYKLFSTSITGAAVHNRAG